MQHAQIIATQDASGPFRALLEMSCSLNSASDIAEILAILAQLALDTGAFRAQLCYVVSDRNGAPEQLETVAVTPTLLLPGSSHGTSAIPDHSLFQLWTANPDEPLYIVDSLTERRLDAASQALLAEAGVRAEVTLPLFRSGRWVGVLIFDWPEPRGFAEEERDVYRLLMHIAAPIVESQRLADDLDRRVERRTAELRSTNLKLQREVDARKRAEEEIQRLNRDLERRARELAAINKTGQVIASSLDLSEVLATVLEEVRRLMNVVAGSIWLLEPVTRDALVMRHSETVSDFRTAREVDADATIDADAYWLVCRQATGPYSEIVRDWRMAPGQGLAGWVVRSGTSLIVPDVLSDARHFKDVDRQTGLALRSILTVPLRVKEDVIGILQVVDTKVNRFTEADLALLEPLAAYAAVAIENARLYEETKRLRDFNENIVQSMEEGVLLEDATGHITFVNTKMAELVGCSPEALIGEHWSKIAPPEHLTALKEKMNKRAPGVADRYETSVLTFDGERVPVIVSARSLFNEIPGRAEEDFTGVLAVFTDITERKQVEETLKRRNEDLTALNAIATTVGQSLDLEHAFSMILEKTLDIIGIQAGTIHLVEEEGTSVKLAAYRGLSRDTAETIEKLQLGESVIGQVAKWGRPIMLDKLDAESTLTFKMKDQTPLCGFAGLPIMAHNQVLGVLGAFSTHLQYINPHELQLLTAIANQVGVVIENTRRVEASSQIEILQELNRLRSELIANASHELRTPLGLIKVFCTSLLAKDVEFDEEVRLKFLHGIDEEADKLKVIVDNLLGLSTLESGRLCLDKQPTDLGVLARQVVAAFEMDLQSANDPQDLLGTTLSRELAQAPSQTRPYRFVCDFPKQSLIVPVDAKRIEQVLRNLLSNAVKYSLNGGTITIQGRGDKWQTLIRVSDEGIGIPAEKLERIFERFYRVESEATRNIGGVGLGLAVCRGIVEAHGGRIWAESTPGVGSNFYFTLPVDDSFTGS